MSRWPPYFGASRSRVSAGSSQACSAKLMVPQCTGRICSSTSQPLRARQSGRAGSALQAHGTVAERRKEARIAPGPTAKVQQIEGRWTLDVFQQRVD